jgi:hypothetical protein
MPDDLDEQIRAAMKTLDEQVPSGYFEALPNQILARLEDGSMQQGTGTSKVMNKPKLQDALMGAPVAAQPAAPATAKAKVEERSEDSGLHDIRNLAQSTKQRMSKARVTQNPPIADDVLASSSGQWKHVALPEPAKMVSLPDIASLPSKAEILAAEKAEAKRLAEETKAKARSKKGDSKAPPMSASDEVLAPVATANAALDAMSAKPASITDIGVARQAFSLPSQQNKRSKGPLIAVLGLGVAAAAGGLIYMQMNGGESKTAASSVAATETVAKAEVPKAPEPTPPPPPAAAAPADEAAAAGSAAEEPAPAEEPQAEDAVVAATETKSAKHAKRGGKGKKVEKDEAPTKEEVKVVEEKKVPEKPEPTKKGAKGEQQAEESFDALLKEAGVEEKKETKPKLEKKSLSADDFKHGMSGIASKAQGCYKGNQGTAMVKLTVGPTGKVTKASVSGQFAGTPEGNCVVSAVKSASFPPWDGGPQSFTYSYMLAD